MRARSSPLSCRDLPSARAQRSDAGRGLGDRLRRIARDCGASASIELALGIIPLVTILLGGMTYGGVLAAMIDINHAAGEGARAAIAGVTTCERRALAETKARDVLMFPKLAAAATITVTATESSVRVDISLPYPSNALTPVVFPVPDTLQASIIANTDGPEFPAQGC